MHKNALVIQNGRCIAAKVAGRIEMLAEVDPAQQFLIRKSLQVGRRVCPAAVSVLSEESESHRPIKRRQPNHTQLDSRRRFGF